MHNDVLETEENRTFQDYNEEETYTHLQEIFNDHVDRREVYGKYARHYVDCLKDETSIKSMEFEEMVSPREYNFMTDRIFVTISRSDLAMMLKKVRGECLDETIHRLYSSRDGFISSYPNHISRWPRVEEWDHNHVYAVVKAYLDKEYPKVENKIVEDIYGDGCVSEVLYDSADFMGQAAIDVAILKSRLKEESEEGYRGP
jgi:polyhydroxyalkanoate synthesis regulator phasin